MKLVNYKPSVTSLRIEITDELHENVQTISELIVIALDKSATAPDLALDYFLVRVRMQCRAMYEED